MIDTEDIWEVNTARNNVVQLEGDLGVGVADDLGCVVVGIRTSGYTYMYMSHPMGSIRTGFALIGAAIRVWLGGLL